MDTQTNHPPASPLVKQTSHAELHPSPCDIMASNMELEGTQKDVPRRDFLWHAGRFFQTSGDALGNAFVESGKAFSTGFNTSSRAIATFSEGVVTELGQSMANAFTGVDSDLHRDPARSLPVA